MHVFFYLYRINPLAFHQSDLVTITISSHDLELHGSCLSFSDFLFAASEHFKTSFCQDHNITPDYFLNQRENDYSKNNYMLKLSYQST